jgi:peptide methionine sulfoxide reductase MsrB
MNSRFLFIWLLLFFICTVQTFAQTEKKVLGKIIDSTRTPIPGVSIKLSVPGSTDTIQTVSDKKGQFSFTVTASKFVIAVSATEFINFNQEYRFNGSYSFFQLGEIMLYPNFKILNTVEVTVSAIVIKEDTIEYKASLFNVKEDASVEDILKRLPGVEVSKNGAVTAQGKPVYKIKVNGKDFFGNDVKMATRELPANIIDKIQVIDDYGDAAAKTGIKTDEPVKIINLQLKKDKSKGMFGNTAAGYGSSSSYQAKLNTNFFSDKIQLSIYGKSNNINNGYVITGKSNTGMVAGGTTGNTGATINPGIQQNNSGIPDGITTTHAAGVNFRVDFGKQNSFYGSYNYTNRKTVGLCEQYAQFIYPAGTYFNNQDYDYSNRGNNHQLSLNLEVYPDSMSYLKISPEIFFNNSNNLSNTDFSFLNNNQKTSEGIIRDSGKMRTPNIGLHILYNRYFHKKGRNLSISFNPSSAQSDMETYRPSFTRIFNTQGTYRDSIQDQQLYQKNSGFNYGFSLSYTEPVFKDRYLDLTYRHDLSRSNNDLKVYSLDTGSTIYHFNAGLSNQFTNRYTGDNIGLSFRTIKKKYNYTLGISLMPVNSKNYSGEKDTVNKRLLTVNVSPLARFSYAFSRSKNLSISYRGSTRQPTTLQLQPVRDISNQQFQKEGNPGLKPEFSHSVNLSYNSFSFASTSSLFSSIGFNTIQNKIVNNSILLDTSGAQLSRPENLNGFYSINGFYNYSKAFNKNKYAVKLNGSFQYYHDAVLVNSKKVSGNNLFLSQGLEFTYKNNKWLEFGIEAVYTLTSVTNLITKANKSNSSTLTFSNNLSMDLPYNLVIKYDFEKIVNMGFDESINKDINLLNISIEKKLLKKKNFYLSFAGYNILNQNFSLNRQVSGNSIMDIRTLQIARYFIFTFTYRWNKFGK